jgi:O-antigen ligase
VDLSARAIALGLVVVAPWLLAGVLGTTQVWLLGPATVAAALLLVRVLLDRLGSIRLPAGSTLLLLAIACGAAQTLPLGRGAVSIFAPATARLRNELAAGPPAGGSLSADPAGANRFPTVDRPWRETVSLYPASTRRDLTLFTLAAGMFLLGGVFFRNARARIALCWVMAINGVALAFFGLVQQLSWNGRLYWQIPLEQGGEPFGPFVNRNHAGGFLTLCLAGAMGAAIWAVRSRDGSRGPSNDDYRHAYDHKPRFFQAIINLLRGWNEASLIALLLAIFIAAGVLCTLSRGSVLSMIAAAAATAAVIARRRQQRVYLAAIVLVAACGLGMAYWLGMTGRLGDRFSTIVQQQTVTEGRVPNWRDGLKAAADFWPSGSGLGTFRYVYRLYEGRLSRGWYYHAENQYLETLIEMGIPGLLLLAMMLGLVVRAAWRMMRDEGGRFAWFGIAGIFAIVAQALHSIGDFDMSIPANMMLFALLCGSLAAAGAPKEQKKNTRAGHSRLTGSLRRIVAWRWLPATMAAAFLLALGLAWAESRRQASIESAITESQFAETSDGATVAELSAAIDRLTSALQGESDHAAGQQHLAELWIQRYRLCALEQLRAERPAATNVQLWPFTSLAVLHKQARDFSQAGLAQNLDELRAAPEVAENLMPAWEHLGQARRGCQLLPAVELLLAQLTFLVDDPGADVWPLERARRLAPGDARVLFGCGLLDIEAGRLDTGLKSWRRCLELDPSRFSEIFALARQGLPPRMIVEQLVPDQADLLADAARRIRNEPQAEFKQALADRLFKHADRADVGDARGHYLRALAWSLMAKTATAIEEYQQAVSLNPQEDGWHYELALLFKQQGQLSAAYQQALLCNRLKPENRDYAALLEAIYPATGPN